MIKISSTWVVLLVNVLLLLADESAARICECQPTDGYLVTRLYNIVANNWTAQDVIDEAAVGFVPIVTKMTGFQQYTAALTGNSSTVFFMNSFSSYDNAKAAMAASQKYVSEGRLNGVITPNQFTEDVIAYTFNAEDCVTTNSTGSFLSSRVYAFYDDYITLGKMREVGNDLYERYKYVDGFVTYGGTLHTPDYDKGFFFNIFENEKGALKGNAMGTDYAANMPKMPNNSLIVEAMGPIMFDHLCVEIDALAAASSAKSNSYFDTLVSVFMVMVTIFIN